MSDRAYLTQELRCRQPAQLRLFSAQTRHHIEPAIAQGTTQGRGREQLGGWRKTRRRKHMFCISSTGLGSREQYISVPFTRSRLGNGKLNTMHVEVICERSYRCRTVVVRRAQGKLALPSPMVHHISITQCFCISALGHGRWRMFGMTTESRTLGQDLSLPARCVVPSGPSLTLSWLSPWRRHEISFQRTRSPGNPSRSMPLQLGQRR